MTESLEQLKARMDKIVMKRRTKEEEEIIAEIAYARHLSVLSDAKKLLADRKLFEHGLAN